MKTWAVVLSLLLIIPSGNVFAQIVRICNDASEWPPYTYYPRVNGEIDRSQLTGATVELMDEIFKMIGLKYSIKLLPWKRCLAEVKGFGENKRYEVFTDGSFNLDRADKYYATSLIYRTHRGVFYSKKKYPNGPQIRNISDLGRFKRICGVLGYSYKAYGADVVKRMSTGAIDMFSVLQQVSLQRCDVFLSGFETTHGGVAIGKYTIPKNIAFAPIPGIKRSSFHIFVSKSSPRAFELLTKINQAILILQNNGVSDRIFRKYLPDY